MIKAEPGDYVWSNYFNQWIEVVQIMPSGYFYFRTRFASRDPIRSKTRISYFERRGLVRKS